MKCVYSKGNAFLLRFFIGQCVFHAFSEKKMRFECVYTKENAIFNACIDNKMRFECVYSEENAFLMRRLLRGECVYSRLRFFFKQTNLQL